MEEEEEMLLAQDHGEEEVEEEAEISLLEEEGRNFSVSCMAFLPSCLSFPLTNGKSRTCSIV